MKTKQSQIAQIKSKFYYDEEGNIDLQSYGTYRHGLTSDEIDDYLKARSGQVRIKKLVKKFNEIAGVNTMAGYQCPCCNYSTCLMYRWDVKRFADVLFDGTPTYWD